MYSDNLQAHSVTLHSVKCKCTRLLQQTNFEAKLAYYNSKFDNRERKKTNTKYNTYVQPIEKIEWLDRSIYTAIS